MAPAQRTDERWNGKVGKATEVRQDLGGRPWWHSGDVDQGGSECREGMEIRALGEVLCGPGVSESYVAKVRTLAKRLQLCGISDSQTSPTNCIGTA